MTKFKYYQGVIIDEYADDGYDCDFDEYVIVIKIAECNIRGCNISTNDINFVFVVVTR